MTDLKLHLFGSPAFEFQGEPVEGLRRKTLAMAAYLAMANRPQPRETIAELLWRDQDEVHGRASLRASLHNLSSLVSVPCLNIDRQSISIHFEMVEIDVRQFLATLDRTRAHLHTDGILCDTCYDALNDAINLYQDDFLKGFSLPDSVEFDNWQTTQREWLSRECVSALRRLAEHAAINSITSLQEALAYGQRWLRIDALDEGAHRLLMRLFAATGQRHEALKQYQDCVRLLDTELATVPDSETVALYEAIRDGEALAGIQPAARSGIELLSAISVLPPLPPLVIGRDTALNEIKARIGIPDSSARRAVSIVEGWPGVGKSTVFGMLAHDPDLKTAFPDGVLWTSLGENPNLTRKLIAWGEALRVIPPGKVLTLDELTGQITAALRDQRVLLIVDDIWQAEHAMPFRVGGQGSVLLMSTRLNSVARAIAPTSTDIYRLPVLDDEFALDLLGRLAAEAVESHPAECLQLVHDLEGLPLAIQVAGRLIHEEISMGWGVGELLAELHSGSGLLTAQAPNDMANTDGYTAPTIMNLLKRSTDALDEDTLVRFALLSLFSAKPAAFDLPALAAAWAVSDPKPTVRTLVNRGLLEPISGGRFQMHALLMLHAKALLEGLSD